MRVNIEALPPEVVAEFAKIVRTDYVEQAQRALREQAMIADHYQRHRPQATEGLGGQTMALHPFLHWEAGEYFNDGNWSADADKVKWYLKQNPAAKVRALGTRVQVGYQAPSGAGGKVSGWESGRAKAETTTSNRRSRTVFADKPTGSPAHQLTSST